MEYDILFKNNPIPNWVYEVDTYRILDVNDSAVKNYGYSREEFLNLTILDLHPESEIPRVKEAHKNIKNRDETYFSGIFTHKKKNGEQILVEIYGQRLQYKNKMAVMITSLDVSEREKILQELKDSEKKLKTATAIANLGYWRLELDKNTLSWSDEVYKIWGLDRHTFPLDFEHFFETIHPDDKEHFLKEQEAAFAGKSDLNFTHRILLPDNSIRWVHELGRIIRDENNKAIAFEGTVQDITQQKEEEQHLRLLESVITNTSDAIIITEAEPQQDPGPRIIFVNEAFTSMSGYSAEEVLGKSPRLLQGPKSDRIALNRMSQAMKKWEPFEITTVNYKKTGEEFWVNFKVSPVANEKGWFTHWIAIERDVTQKKIEEIEKSLLARISAAFYENDDVNSGLKQVCREIVNYGDFIFCEIWLPHPHKKELSISANHSSQQSTSDFYARSKNTKSVPFGEGIPGFVFDHKESVIWDITGDQHAFVRTHAARAVGVKTVMGFPLLFQNKPIAVLVIGTTELPEKTQRHRNIFNRLQTYIGSEINRKQTETNLRHLFEALPDIICTTDFNGVFLKFNKAGCELLGYTEDEIVGKNFGAFVHPDDVSISIREFEKLKKGETVFKFKNRYLNSSGKIIWLSWHCNSNISDGMVYASAKNITEEVQLQELASDAARMALIGGWEIDMINGKLIWSDVVHQIYETDPAHYIPDVKTSITYYKEEFRDKVTDIVQKAIESGESFDFEAALISAKGNEKWVRAIGQAQLVNGICVRIYGSFQDITSIKSTQHRLSAITNDLPGVTFQYTLFPDGSDRISSISKAAKHIWGLAPEEIEKDTACVWEQVKRGGDFDRVKASIREAVKEQKKWHCQYKIINENGGVRFHEGIGSPQFFPDGSIVFNSMIFDITEEKKANLLIAETSKLALVGSWELNMKSQSGDAMYWSPMLREILEVDADYNPSLSGGFEFYEAESKARIEQAVKNLTEKRVSFDEILLVKTAKNNYKWVRCIGNGDFYKNECLRVYGSYQDISERVRSEEKLKAAYEEKNKIIESIGDAFFTIDRNFVVSYWNSMAEKLLSVKREQLLGKNLWEVFPDAVQLPSYTFYHQAMKTNQAVSFEDYYGMWLEVDAYPNEEGLTVFFRDITPRKEADLKLKEALEEKNKILESIGDAFFAVDNNWVVTYWNHIAEKVLFRKKEEVLGKKLWEEFKDAVDSAFYTNYHKARETMEVITFEEYYPALSVWFEVTVYPNENGLSVYFKDVSLRKETDLKILEANERFEKVAEATADAIWDWDIENNRFYRGKGFENIFGPDYLKEMKQQDFWKESFHIEDLPGLIASIDEAIKNPGVVNWEKEYRIIHSEGKTKTVLDKGVIIRNENGKATRMVGAVTDITFRKDHERVLEILNADLKKNIRELQLANEELEQFAFIASHDLQEPLRMVSSFMDQLKKKYSDQLDEKANQYIHFAIDGAKRMKKIILDLLEYSRAGRSEKKAEPIDLNEIVNDYKTLRRKVIEEKSVEFIAVNLPTVNVQLSPLVQTMHCILDNAIKYTKTGVAPRIEIRTQEEEDYWKISVSDNGIGIDNQFLDKIFVIFQRLHDREEYEGTGIGLAIVKKHVESWGGMVEVESEPGKGSTFSFTIKK